MSRRTRACETSISFKGVKAYLEHSEQEMLFSTFVLVSVDSEHDSLEQRINLRHRDEPAEMCNVSRLRLEQKQKVSVFLGFVVVRENTLLHFKSIFEMAGNFVLLQRESELVHFDVDWRRTSSRAIRFWISNAIRESR